MASIRDYHRPTSIAGALALLAGDGAVVIGGGTVVLTQAGDDPVEVVDLQALGLDMIASANGSVTIGATVRLQDVVDSAEVPPLLATAARREAPSTIRNAATVGGAVATGDPDSGFLGALLVHDAVVRLHGPAGPEDVSLRDLLADRSLLAGAIITAVTLQTGGEASWAATGRTPADVPIVAAYARIGLDGAVRLALTGVAASPVLVEPGAVADLDPPGDFRGSSAYRSALAGVLASRVLEAVAS